MVNLPFFIIVAMFSAVGGVIRSQSTRGVRLARGALGGAVQPMPKGFGVPATSRLFLSTEAGGEDTVVSRCTKKIQDALNPVKLVVQAAHDDPNGSHIAVEVVSTEFEGQRTVQRQRLVYKAIWDEMADGGSVHAVDQIIAKTPEEAGM
jgi:stress-induced morphogen